MVLVTKIISTVAYLFEKQTLSDMLIFSEHCNEHHLPAFNL